MGIPLGKEFRDPVCQDLNWQTRQTQMLKHIFSKFMELLNRVREREPFYQVRYLSVPIWRPWRDF